MFKKYRRNKTTQSFLKKLSQSQQFSFTTFYNKNFSDPLAELCDKYGSDKGEIRNSGHPYPWQSHSYTDYYSRIFSGQRNIVQAVFECGLGTNNPNLLSSMQENGKPGASLRVWRDYFPNAQIFGADIDKEILFQEDRIKTFYIDQLNKIAIAECWDMIGNQQFDLIIDDGLHTYEAGKTLFENSFQKLKQNGIYVIEDVEIKDLIRYRDFFKNKDFFVEYIVMSRPNVDAFDNNLVVIRN